MRTVGIIGGIGPESTIDYYRRILAECRGLLAGAPSIVINSIDLDRVLSLAGANPKELANYLSTEIRRLADAGADFAVLAANTPHLVFDVLSERAPIPLLSIVEVTRIEAEARSLRRLALFGTRFTMEAEFYSVVMARSGVTVVRPDERERALIHERYVTELVRGIFRDETRREFQAITERLGAHERIDGVILGGTELPLLLPDPEIAGLPMLDTTALHVRAIVQRLLDSSAVRPPCGDPPALARTA